MADRYDEQRAIPDSAPELERTLNVVLEYAQRRTLGKLPTLIAQALLLAAREDLKKAEVPRG